MVWGKNLIFNLQGRKREKKKSFINNGDLERSCQFVTVLYMFLKSCCKSSVVSVSFPLKTNYCSRSSLFPSQDCGKVFLRAWEGFCWHVHVTLYDICLFVLGKPSSYRRPWCESTSQSLCTELDRHKGICLLFFCKSQKCLQFPLEF